MTEAITIRPFRPGDEEALLRAHNRVFPAMQLDQWRWKYLDNPVGQVHVMLAEHERDGVVGAYPTMPVWATVDGERRLAGQCVDQFVLPEHRRHGPRPGLFVNTALAHYELWGGHGGRGYSFHHGWPTQGWRIGEKYLRYTPIRDWDVLFREIPPDGLPPRATPTTLEVRRVARYGADVDALWAEFEPSTRLAVVRDQRYLNWRYADAPGQCYELCECREQSSGRLRGVAVVARRDFVMPNTCFLVDWLVPADDADATVALVAAAERRAAEIGCATLATLFQHRDPRFLGFQRLGFLVFGTVYFQVVIPFDRHDTLFYKEAWYHTLGDSDLV